MLTGHASAPIVAHLSSGDEVTLELKAETFADITQTLVQKTMQPVRRALRDAGLTPSDIKGVILVGGATRMPRVRRAVAEYFGQPPLTNLNPGRSRRDRRGDPGERPGRQSRSRRGLAAARRHSACRSASRRWEA